MNPCVPSPCGPYSNCRSQNGHAVCSCQINYVGAPPNCRPECMGSSDCPQDKSCFNQHCKDTCPGTCGTNANCRVVNHNPICYCMSGFTGDPFIRCVYEEKRPIVNDSLNSCMPSPCGPNSQCRVSNANEQPVCSCLPNYIGRAPNCRPECTSNSECRSNQACVNRRCKDSCQGSCGSFTTCIVNNHRPICRCLPGYTGDPFAECSPQIIITPEKSEPCNPSPCGTNAVCKERNGVGSCTCLPEYNGDPYTECRPECVLNSDCAKNRACVNNKCRDPCPGVCGVGAECHVINHSPSCSCSAGFTGNPSEYCRKEVKPIEATQPCRPSPCGPYSKCLEVNDHAVCSCLANHIGTPPACRPECSISSECSQDRACVNLRCIDPCPGTCGVEAFCKVTNHNPICSCPSDYTGDPFISCLRVDKRKKDDFPTNPCIPSPCGPNSLCRVVGETPVCSCLPNFVGRAPNCRPECSINSECPANLACINEICKDPCPGSCGFNALCNVVNHSPLCTCDAGYSGDPFAGCAPAIPPEEHLTPCNPSPCGANAECRERNSAGSCTCIEGYFGDSYSGCRPECVVNSDCPRDKSCNNNKCTDPCPGVCGINAECRISNHVPTCHCSPGYTGNPLSSCRVIPELEPTPRSPPNCRPECIISSDCAQNMACQNQKCIDPCPGTCGTLARCQVINHYAACSCPPGYTGDPFNSCSKIKCKHACLQCVHIEVRKVYREKVRKL
uniref:EGF-like domain-containing protein n=1 Tax=Glossina pallidipes TaxID=7398 RepID=A0A1A9ZCQ5_GLOPL